MNGACTYWLGATRFLNISLGHERIGDDEADVDPLWFGLPLAMCALGDNGNEECGG